MKKLILLALVAMMISSCAGSKNVRVAKKTIKGDWILDHVSYNDLRAFKVTLFNDASKECFEKSLWHFVPNNNTGTYEMQNAQCDSGKRYFSFTIQEIDPEKGLFDFLLKPTDEKKHSKDNKGFRLHLKHLSADAMQWEQSLMMDGEPFIIHMNFSKIEKQQ